MLFFKAIIFIASVVFIIYCCHYIVVELGFPRSLIEAMKRYVCPVCGKRHWTPYGDCSCKGSPEYYAWLRKIQQRKQTAPRSYRDRERDCPLCHGEAGNYMCPMCEGRGKTFM